MIIMIKAIIFDLDDTTYPVHVKTINTLKVKVMLERLKKRYKLVVLSNGFRYKINAHIKGANYENLFVKVYGPNCFVNRKPLPNKIHRILRELNITKDNAIIVGDKQYTDILVAKLSGIKSVLVTNGKKKRLFVKPDYKINSVLDLERVLEKL